MSSFKALGSGRWVQGAGFRAVAGRGFSERTEGISTYAVHAHHADVVQHEQARAFGVGVLIATQNPMDLDYRALSNAGVWALGTLQTDADRERVIEGLASGERKADQALDNTVHQLAKRWFVMPHCDFNQPSLLRPAIAEERLSLRSDGNLLLVVTGHHWRLPSFARHRLLPWKAPARWTLFTQYKKSWRDATRLQSSVDSNNVASAIALRYRRLAMLTDIEVF